VIDDESHWPLSFLCSKSNLPRFCMYGLSLWPHSCDLCWSTVQWIMKHLVIHLGGRNSLLLPSGLSSQGTEGQSNWGALSTSATYSNSQKAQPAKERCSVLGTGPIIILVWGDEAGCTWRV